MGSFTRRDVLRASAALAGIGLLGCEDDDEPAPPNGKRVVVIGAGMSGVSCASALSRAGFEVVVLEARNRIGGRVATDRRFGFPIELGANWIEGGGRGSPLTPIARENDVRLVVADDEFQSYDHDGRRLSDAEVERIDESFAELTEAAEAVAEDRDRDLSYQAAFDAALEDEELSAFERRATEFSLAAVETDTAGSLRRLSAWWGTDDDGFSGDDYLMPDGYDRIVAAVADGLDVHLRAPVTRVTHRSGGVVVRAGENHEADAAVVTVPLGVLERDTITFSPALPSPKRRAIRRLEMGTLDKVILRFDRVRWPDAQQFAYLSETRGEFPEILNWAAVTGQPVLKLFTGGDYALRMERRSDTRVVRDAMSVLRRCFGATLPDPVQHVVSRWAADPLAGGSYSFVPVGAEPDDRDALAAPVGDALFFAGEATHRRMPATVHGAFLSGVRAAEEVVEALA